jgi:butyryl-CoA dehydrogenase
MDFELSDEQHLLREMARAFAEREMVPALRNDERNRNLNNALIKKLAEQGLLALHLPQEYGGGGMDLLNAAIAWEQLSWSSWTQMLGTMGHAILAGSILTRVASPEQKEKYLPPLCRGDLIIAVAAVEPNAGSDAGAIETTAESDGDYWIINGSKNFITTGGVGDVVLVLVTTDKSKGPAGIALVAVEKNTPGFTSSSVQMLGGWSVEMSNLGFSDCRVPKSNLIGQVGRGLQNSLIGIDNARLSISAGCIGMAQSCLDACIKYTQTREQFGKPIASFQLMQEEMARMYAEINAIRWQVYYAAYLKSKGLPHGKELSAAKWLASEMVIRVAANAIRIHGAYGCTDDFPVEHHYRDAVLTNILGGTTEMHKLMIGRELTGINAMTR